MASSAEEDEDGEEANELADELDKLKVEEGSDAKNSADAKNDAEQSKEEEIRKPPAELSKTEADDVEKADS